jgi:hypothetical protein
MIRNFGLGSRDMGCDTVISSFGYIGQLARNDTNTSEKCTHHSHQKTIIHHQVSRMGTNIRVSTAVTALSTETRCYTASQRLVAGRGLTFASQLHLHQSLRHQELRQARQPAYLYTSPLFHSD